MAAEERPRIRPELKFVRHESEGAVAWVVKDPATMKYYRFGQIEAWLMQQMDGAHTLGDICAALAAETGLQATPAALGGLVRRLRELHLVERSPEEQRALLMEQIRNQRKQRLDTRNTLLRMRFSFGDPDRLLARWVDRLGFFWTPGFVYASIPFFLLYIVLLAYNWGAVQGTIASAYAPGQVTLGVFVASYLTFTVVALIHEVGHGLTCKRFGGQVPEIGGMMLYFMPAFYCNISDAWTFSRRDHRLWVTFAGGWIQLWVAGAGLLVWLVTEPGTALNSFAMFTAALGGILSIAINFNPLIPLDGYYALVDWLELPNLRARAMGYLGALLKRFVLRLPVPLPDVTRREARIFVAYAVLALAYTAFLLFVIGRFAWGLLVGHLGGWGLAIFALLLLAATRSIRLGALRLARVVTAEKLPPSRRRRAATLAVAALALLAVTTAAVPFTVRARANAVVEPAGRIWLRPPQQARLLEVPVGEGGVAAPGQVLALLRDPQLEVAHAESSARLRELVSIAAADRARGHTASARVGELAAAAERERLVQLDRLRERLVLRAPTAGTVATPRLEDRIGETIAAGDSLVEFWAAGPPRLRIELAQKRSGEVAVGTPVRVRFPAYPQLTWHTRVQHIEAAADGDHIVLAAPVPAAAAATLTPGMIGYARVDIRRTSVAGAIARAARRNVRLDLLL